MPGFLTASSTMMCPHGGTVIATPAAANVQAAGTPMLSAADTFMIAGCPFMIALVPSPCLTVQWVSPAVNSSRGGSPTLTLASVGLCLAATQAPQGPIVIAAAQPQVAGT